MFDHLKVYPGIVCEFAQSLSGENIPSHPRIQAMIAEEESLDSQWARGAIFN